MRTREKKYRKYLVFSSPRRIMTPDYNLNHVLRAAQLCLCAGSAFQLPCTQTRRYVTRGCGPVKSTQQAGGSQDYLKNLANSSMSTSGLAVGPPKALPFFASASR